MKLLTFRLDGVLFGIDIKAVKELNRNVWYTPAPTASDDVIGLCNIRGRIVTLFDLSYMLGYGKLALPERLNCIVLKDKGGDSVGFAADMAEDVLVVDDGQIKEPPANISASVREYLTGIAELAEDLLLIINQGKLFA